MFFPNLIFSRMWHRVSTEDDLRVLQDDVFERVAKGVRLALEDERATVLRRPAVVGKHHLKQRRIFLAGNFPKQSHQQ